MLSEDREINYMEYLSYLEDIGDPELVGYFEEDNTFIINPQEILDNYNSKRKTFSKTFRYALLKRAGWKCAECSIKVSFSRKHREKLGYELAHIDHIIPISKSKGYLGDIHCSDNLQILCEACNLKKSDKI